MADQKGISEGLVILIIVVCVVGVAAVYFSGVLEGGAPSFEVDGLSVSPGEVTAGEAVDAEVEVSNVGNAEGSYVVELLLDGEVYDNEEVTLAAGESTTVSFSVSVQISGTHSVSAGDYSEDFKVEAADWMSPIVSFKSPTDGASVSAGIQVSGLASDASGISRLELIVDNVKDTGWIVENGATVSTGVFNNVSLEDNEWSAVLDTRKVSDGVHSLMLIAVDGYGNSATKSVSIQVGNGGILGTCDNTMYWSTSSSGGASVEMSTVSGVKGDALKATYSGTSGGSWSVGKTTYRNLAGYSSIGFQLKGDSNPVRIQIEDNGGELWTSTLSPTQDWGSVSIPFEDFAQRSGQQPADAVVDGVLGLNNVKSIKFIQPTGDNRDASGELFIDEVTFSTLISFTGGVIQKGESAPEIDGSIDEVWNNANAYRIVNVTRGPGELKSEGDLSGKWRSLWTSDALYFLAQVSDESLVKDSSDPYNDDLLEIYIDADYSHGTSFDGVNDFQYWFTWDSEQVQVGPNSTGRTSGIDYVMQETENGYIAEVVIPNSTTGLNAMKNACLGLDVQINDDDDGGAREGKKAWYSVNDQTYQDPSLFAKTILTDLGGGGTPPSPPSGLSPSVISSTRIDLSWNESPDPVHHYNVYRRKVGENRWGPPIMSTTTTSYPNGALLENASYEYAVTAVDSAGNESEKTPPASTGGKPQWKKDAEERIENIRMREMDIVVEDADGQPIENVNLEVEQVRHHFGFGTAVSADSLASEQYRNFVKNNFEWVTPGNAMKWYSTEANKDEITYEDAETIVEFCEANNIKLHGHTLFWAPEQWPPDWVKELSQEELQSQVENRLIDIVTHFKGKVDHWDVLNEGLHGDFYKRNLGPDIRTWMFEKANEIAPEAKMFINDYNIIAGKDLPEYKELIQELIENGAPIEAVGAQCHFGGTSETEGANAIDPLDVLEKLDSLAELDLPVWLTEFDAPHPDAQVRAKGLEKFYYAAFSHPAVHGVTMWGFWANDHWRGENAAIVEADWTVNAAGEKYQELLDKWTTKTSGTTAENGAFSFKGFHGTYEVKFTAPDGKEYTKEIKLEPGEEPKTVTVKKIDWTAPELSVSTPSDGETVENDMDFSATATDDSTITDMIVSIDDKESIVVEDGEVVSSGTFRDVSFEAGELSAVLDTTALSEGPHVLKVTAEDNYGNLTERSLEVTVNNIVGEGASLPFESLSSGDTLTGEYEVSGRVSSDSEIVSLNVSIDGSEYSSWDWAKVEDNVVENLGVFADTSFEDNQWSAMLDTRSLTNGSHTLTVEVEDEFGTASENAVEVQISNGNMLDPFETVKYWENYAGNMGWGEANPVSGVVDNAMKVTYVGGESDYTWWGVRRAFERDFSSYTGVQMKIKGDPNPVRITIRDNGNERWAYSLSPSDSWENVRIPFENFIQRRDWQPATAEQDQVFDLGRIMEIDFLQPYGTENRKSDGEIFVDELKLYGKEETS